MGELNIYSLLTDRQIISGFRQMIPDFNGFLQQLSPVVQEKLQSTYAL